MNATHNPLTIHFFYIMTKSKTRKKDEEIYIKKRQ